MTHILLFGASGGIGGGVLLEILDRYPSVTLIVPHRSTSDIPSVPLGPHQTLVPIPWDPDQPDRLATDLAPMPRHDLIYACVPLVGSTIMA